MAIGDNGVNEPCNIFIVQCQANSTIDKSVLEKIPEQHANYINVPPPSYDETILETSSQRASLTEDDIFETTAEVAYGDRSSRPSLIGERPLQIRDYLFISAAYFCSFCNVGFMNALSILGIELLKTFSNAKAIILIIPAIGIGLSSAAGLLVGLLINKFGCSAVIIAGGVLQSLALLISVFGNHAMFLLFTMGVLLGIGCCCVYVTNAVFIGIYFGNRAPVFLSILATAGPSGAIVFPFLITFCVDLYGWRGTLLIFSGIFFNVIPCGIFLWFCQKKAENMTRKNVIQLPENVNTPKKLLDASVFKNLLFNVFLFTMSTTMGFMNIFITILPSFLFSKGFSLSMSAQACSIMFITSVPPKLIMGIILKLTGWNFEYIFIIISLGFSIMSYIITLVTGYTPLLACCITMGLLIGIPIGLYSLVVLELIGRQKYSSAMGISETINGIVIICQGLISGVLINTYDSYELPLYTFAAVSIFTNLIMATSLGREHIKKIQFNLKLLSKK